MKGRHFVETVQLGNRSLFRCTASLVGQGMSPRISFSLAKRRSLCFLTALYAKPQADSDQHGQDKVPPAQRYARVRSRLVDRRLVVLLFPV